MPPRKFASGTASWVICTDGNSAALLDSYSWNPVDCPKILSGMQKLVLLLLCLAHTGQPFGKRQNQGDTETDWRHNDAVPKFFTRFLIFFAVHNSHSCSCIGCTKIIRESPANCLLIKERMSFSVDKGKFFEWYFHPCFCVPEAGYKKHPFRFFGDLNTRYFTGRMFLWLSLSPHPHSRRLWVMPLPISIAKALVKASVI